MDMALSKKSREDKKKKQIQQKKQGKRTEQNQQKLQDRETMLAVHSPRDTTEESDMLHEAIQASLEDSGDAIMDPHRRAQQQQQQQQQQQAAPSSYQGYAELLVRTQGQQRLYAYSTPNPSAPPPLGDHSWPKLPTPPAQPREVTNVETDAGTSATYRPLTFKEYLLPKPHASTLKAAGVLSNACTLVTGDLGPLALLQPKLQPKPKTKPQLLLELPTETLSKICEATILFDRRAGSSLLLTCKELSEITFSVYGDAAKEYAKDHDSMAVELFEPAAEWDLYLEWMPRLLSRSSPILQIIKEAERLHNVYWVTRKAPLEPFTYPAARSVFKVGLYLLGMLHFQCSSDLATNVAETFLDSLPGAALLVLRVTSIMMFALFNHQYSLIEFRPLRIVPRTERRDLIQDVETASRRNNNDFDPELVPCVFEKLLLTSGLRWPAYTLDHKDEWSQGDCDPLVEKLAGTMRNIDYCAKLDQEHRIVVSMKRSRYDIKVSERIAAEYPDEAGMLSQEWERIDALLDKIGEWVDGRSELEILKELKASTALYHD